MPRPEINPIEPVEVLGPPLDTTPLQGIIAPTEELPRQTAPTKTTLGAIRLPVLTIGVLAALLNLRAAPLEALALLGLRAEP